MADDFARVVGHGHIPDHVTITEQRAIHWGVTHPSVGHGFVIDVSVAHVR